jgi:apolipoprotein N-acyltransferase
MIPQSIESQRPGEARTLGSRFDISVGTRTNAPDENTPTGLSIIANVAWIIVAATAFHLAYFSSTTAFLVILHLFALLQLSRNSSGRKAFYSGLSVGMLIAVGRLDFFWNIFGGGCVALWLVFAFWIGLFTALARLCRERFGTVWGWVLIPFVWCGLEYFRSELYYLRFSWLSPGYAFATNPSIVPLHQVGTYGVGFLLAWIACIAAAVWDKSKTHALFAMCSGAGLVFLLGILGNRYYETPPLAKVHVAGVQMEFPGEQEVLVRLNDLIRRHPEAELLVLSEYTFNDPVPEKVKSWCRQHQRYLIVGGKDPSPGANYFDTAFVISPAGEIVFRQGKKVPIQCFKDGLPAVDQRLWNSPWGNIGICICYDLSYSRVTDRLVELGAQALIVPTMDVVDWGKRQHELHARVAPVRAKEYGIPVFRVGSSGISQLVIAQGRTVASAPCPGDGAMLAGVIEMRTKGHLPLDRWLSPAASVLAGLIAIISFVSRGRAFRKGSRPKAT